MAVSGFHAPSASSSAPTSSATSLAPPASKRDNNKEMYYIKGSIDAILDRCKFYYVSDDSTPGLDANTRSVILTRANAAASRGLRVLAMAYGHGAVESSAAASASASPCPLTPFRAPCLEVSASSGGGRGSPSGCSSMPFPPSPGRTPG